MKREQMRESRGFAMIELLLVVGIVGVLATIAYALIWQVDDGVRATKLHSDVDSLNEAVQVYLANGGSMDGVETVAAAVSKLQTKANSDSATRVVGLKGAMLDERLEAEMLKDDELTSSIPRARWNSEKKRFYVDTSGTGAKGFILIEASSDLDPLEEARATALAYADQAGWVWDYSDSSLAAKTGVEAFGEEAPATASYTSPAIPPGATALAPPTISRPGGIYSFFDFALEVEIENPNPEGVSAIYYTLNDTHWNVYTGVPILVGPDQTLKTYTVSYDASSYADSEFEVAHYASSFIISGGAGGDFLDPQGSEWMVTNLAEGEAGSYFTFGTATGTPDPSWLLFNGASFADVSVDENFLLGTIDYYNGTIASGTQASGVGLSIDLSFDGGAQNIVFNYDLELISTPNLDSNTAMESADFVRLGDIYSETSVQLGGSSYDLILEFGETSAGGFSSIDQFHVIEGQAASGNLYGRLIEVTGEEG